MVEKQLQLELRMAFAMIDAPVAGLDRPEKIPLLICHAEVQPRQHDFPIWQTRDHAQQAADGGGGCGDARRYDKAGRRIVPPAPGKAVEHQVAPGHRIGLAQDRKSVVEGKSVSVCVDLGWRRLIKKKKDKKWTNRMLTTKHTTI